METHFTQVNEKLQLILTSGVTNSLIQHIRQTNSAPQRPLLLSIIDDSDPQRNAVPSAPPSTALHKLDRHYYGMFGFLMK